MNCTDQTHGENWTLYQGDSAELLTGLPSGSVHLSVFSPPFGNLYIYTPSDRDLGNVKNKAEFFDHFGYITRELLRAMMPGRIVAMHAYDIQQYANVNDGIRNRYDFPGDIIRHMEEVGFAYRGRISIDKNPQAAAIRNHPQELLFGSLRKDAAKLAVSQADYILIFLTPGENPEPIVKPIDEDTWIKWARPVWTDIRETAVLDDIGGKEADDERHLCPLQLPVIERCVSLWSNPGDVVLSPFAGVGSEGYQSLLLHRRFIGMELKASYFRCSVKNLKKAETLAASGTLFDLITDDANEPESIAAT